MSTPPVDPSASWTPSKLSVTVGHPERDSAKNQISVDGLELPIAAHTSGERYAGITQIQTIQHIAELFAGSIAADENSVSECAVHEELAVAR